MSDGHLPFRNTLPRTLMTKSGFLPDPNQRLPSFKNSLIKTSIVFQGLSPSPKASPTKTKNNSFEECSDKIVKSTPPRNTNAKLRRISSKNNKYKKVKKLVQLESTVFTGVPPRPSNTRQSKSSKTAPTGTSVPPNNSINEETNQTIEEKVDHILLSDDFIEDFDDDDPKSELLPQGWHNLFSTNVNQCSEDDAKDLECFSKDNDGFVFLQLPRFFPTNSNGKIGKLRVWKSGKIEIVRPSQNEVFDVIPISPESEEKVPPEMDSLVSPSQKPIISRELVSYNARVLSCLGPIELSNSAVVVPRVLSSESKKKSNLAKRITPKVEKK